jgi:hypothetical protein
MKPMKTVARSTFGNYFNPNRRFPDRLTLWTIYFKDSSCGRGEYCEEIDVWAKEKTEAMRIALTVIQHEYQPDCRPARASILRMSEFIDGLDAVEQFDWKD